MIGSSTCGLTFQLARPNDGNRCHRGRITCLLKGATAAPIAKPATCLWPQCDKSRGLGAEPPRTPSICLFIHLLN